MEVFRDLKKNKKRKAKNTRPTETIF